VSEPPFASLDFAIQREPTALRENQRRLAESVGFDPDRLYQTKQVHGRSVLRADGDPALMLGYEADALIADPGSRAAVAVRVADCVPILIADPGSGRVAAVHAGWRGVVADVVGATVRHLGARESGSSTPREAGGFVAAIGPCIGACCFEVSEEVAVSIARTTAEGVITRRDEHGKCFVDLRSAVRTQLRALGLSDTRIDDVPGRGRSGCTKCESALFYSYRRDGDASGRLIAAIVAR
jgi:YfiH family protein